MAKALDVVVVGNVGIDTNVYLPGGDIDFSVEANFTENLDYVGQAGGYASRGYARLGKQTAFIGYVGQDYNGRHVLEVLAQDGIDTTALFVDPQGTARSINFVYRDGRRRNFYDGKGHMRLQPDLEACRRVLARARLAHVHIPNWARYLLPMARELGLTIGCDIQDVTSVDDAYRRDFVDYADVLFLSAVNYPDPSPLIEAYLSRRPDLIVVVGLGAEGCALGTEAGIRIFPPVEMDQPVIDTNGAGDGLAVGFLSSYVLDGYGLAESVLRGQIAARYSCGLKATTSELMTMAQLDDYFASRRP
jgi:sugar/nucleoside kinase (ribokinase family)